jgi:hypothetical protein
MGQADKLFTDGEAYERLMGRWAGAQEKCPGEGCRGSKAEH